MHVVSFSVIWYSQNKNAVILLMAIVSAVEYVNRQLTLEVQAAAEYLKNY